MKGDDTIKKLIPLIVSLVFIVSLLSSCETTKPTEGNKLSIVSTIFPYYDFAREIAGDKCELSMLIPPGSESHDYEPSPKDIININNSDIFIYNGGESDAWVDKILSSIDNDVKIIKMIDYVSPICIHSKESEHIHNSHEDHHNEVDEHIWTSPVNAIALTKVISQEIQSLDSNNAEFYQNNTDNYVGKLKNLHFDFSNLVNKSNKKSLVIADRFPLIYFTSEYNLEYISAFSGCSSDTQPSIKTVKSLIDYTENNNISVVYHMDFSNENLAKLISEDTDSKVYTLYSCHNITKEQFEDGVTYYSLMELNLKSLKEALN